VPRDAIGPDGTVTDPDFRARLAQVLRTVAESIGGAADEPEEHR
jgi:hypothetical protein